MSLKNVFIPVIKDALLNVVIDYDFEKVILSILKLHLCSFNECSLIKLKK